MVDRDHGVSCPKMMQGLSCTVCEDLTDVERELQDAEAVVAALKTKRTMLFERRNRTHDALTSRLPIELVSQIFMDFVPIAIGDHKDYNLSMNRPSVFRRTPLLLGAVSTAWRTIAWSTPQLWTSIIVDVSHISDSFVDVLGEWLGRSGEHPLYIDFCPIDRDCGDIGVVGKISEVFAQYAHRWIYLNIGIHPSLVPYIFANIARAVMLDTLKIEGPLGDIVIDLGMIANLKHLNVDLDVNNLANVNWNQLTHFEGDISTISTFYELFSQASFLTYCSFCILSNDDDDTMLPVLQHNFLSSLKITYWTAAIGIALAGMKFPALEHLAIRQQKWAITDLLHRSSCSLKTLELASVDVQLVPFLSEIPSLETLKIIVDSSHYIIDHLLMKLSEIDVPDGTTSDQHVFLPNLRALTIKHLQFSWSVLLDVLLAHFEHPILNTASGRPIEDSENTQQVRPFNSLCIYLWNDDVFPLNLEPDIAVDILSALEGGYCAVNLVIKSFRDHSQESFRNYLKSLIRTRPESPVARNREVLTIIDV